jgi:hypothetical protein
VQSRDQVQTFLEHARARREANRDRPYARTGPSMAATACCGRDMNKDQSYFLR